MKNKNYYLVGIAVLFIAFFALSINHEKEIEESESNLNENPEIELPREIIDPNEITLETPRPKTSWAGTMNNITIDGTGNGIDTHNWTSAEKQPWCTLTNGIYIIENVTINAGTSPTGSGILINNSNNKNFIIRNCTIYDAAHDVYPTDIQGGIKLINSSRGQIYSNDLTSTTGSSRANAGLALFQCKNITVINNTLEGSRYGLFMRFSNESLIFNNSADSNQDVGIFLHTECHYNNITNNTANNNDADGFRLWSGCDNNNIINNTANGNLDKGINLFDSDNNDLIDNTVNNNKGGTGDEDFGILIEGSNYNNIINNTVRNNGNDGYYEGGIYLKSGSNNNTIANNTINDSFMNGIYLFNGCHDNNITGNDARNNGGYGIRVENNCDNNIITGNDFSGTVNYDAIYLYNGCDNNTVGNNDASNSGRDGIFLYKYIYTSCSDNIFYGNIINDNTRYGVTLGSGCNYNTFIGNNLTNNFLNNFNDAGTGNLNAMNCIDGVCTPLIIDDDGGTADSFTWAEVLRYVPWFSGSGTPSDPYVIEDIEIDASVSFPGSSGNGLLIIDSDGKDFIIRKCTIYDAVPAGVAWESNGNIRLENSNKGQIYSNDLTSTTGADEYKSGIYLAQCENITIINNTIDGSTYGIFMINSNKILIFNNSADSNNRVGIYLAQNCDYNNITQNSASHNNWYYGIALQDDSDNNNIINNTINDNGQGRNNAETYPPAGIKIYKGCDDNNIIGNYLTYNWDYGIYLELDCHNNTIRDNTDHDNGNDAIRLYNNCDDNKIIHNLASNTGASHGQDWGIYLSTGCDNNLIENNTANGNEQSGIHLNNACNNNIIENNTANGNEQSGIHLNNACNNNNITNNILRNNEYGISLENQVVDSIVSDNYIFNNSGGIYILTHVDLCEIYNNDIINNTIYGVNIEEPTCDDNLFYNNTFTGNANHAYDEGTNTYWNNTEIGNYWDDYSDDDDDDDNIGDNKYLVYSDDVFDYLPIWWDAPVIIIITPVFSDIYGNATINFTLSIDKTDVNFLEVHMWYMLVNATKPSDKTNNQSVEAAQYPDHYILFNFWNMFENGKINIWFFVNDSRGYIGYANVTIEKNVDIPTISLISIGFYGVGGVSSINFTVSLDGPEVHEFWYRIHNGTEWSDNFTFTAVIGQLNKQIDQNYWENYLGNGTWQIQFYLNDKKAVINNKTSIEITFRKDIYAPHILIYNPSNYDFFKKEPAPIIIFNITEHNLHQIWYCIDDGTTTRGNSTYLDEIEGEIYGILDGDWSAMDNGSVTIKFWANDTGGNVNYTIISLFLWKDINIPESLIINTPNPIVRDEYQEIAPSYNIDFNEPNFDYIVYELFDGATSYFSSQVTTSFGFIDQSLWNQLNNGQINVTFYVYDKAGNYDSVYTYIIKQAPTSSVTTPLITTDDDDNGDDNSIDWIIRALIAGLISGAVGLTIRITYHKIKKRREAARESASPTVVLKKKYQIVHHDFLTSYKKVEKKECRVGIAQVGLSEKGNLLTELYEMTPEGLMRIREDMVETVIANIKGMIESAHENGINILLFPEMTFDLNYKEMVKETKNLAKEYDMYIITGGYHDIKTKQNICVVYGPEGIQWEQVKHTPATIHFGKHVFTEAIEIHHPPHKLHICSTEFGRIAIAICRDFLDMDLRVEIKNCEPPVDLFFNPAYTPVIVDFEATHFDARRSVYAYTFFANVAEYGGTIINTPEKDRTKRQIPPKEEGLIFKDVDLFSLRSERTKWERSQSKEKRYIQSTRS